MALTFEPGPAAPATSTKVGIIDADVHPSMNPVVPQVLKYLPTRWQEYVKNVGAMHGGSSGGERPPHREYASRWDAEPPEGGAPGSNPQFAAAQLLDKYDMSGAVLNDIGGVRVAGAGGPAGGRT